MIQQSTSGTPERWPEKSAGVFKPFGRIALIFLDFLVRFASRQNEYRSKSIILKIKYLISIFLLSTSIHTKAKYQARGILEHFYGENYIDCCTPPDGNKSTVADFNKNDLAKAMGLYIEAMPNPAKHYTEFEYTLPYGVNQAILNIFDAGGKLLEQMALNSPINKIAYNTSELVSGSYTIEIKTNNYSFATKLIIQ
jgi:hypothetical protein